MLVHGALKLAIKFDCDALRARLVENIEADWPQTLTQWDARQKEAIIARSEHLNSKTGKVDNLFLDDRLPEPASAIRLAIDFNIPSILPAAFYQLSLLGTEADWDAYREDPSKRLRFGARSARWKLLDREDLMRLVHGQKQLAAYTRAIGTDLFGKCPRNSQGCSKARNDCWKYMQESAPVSMDDPLDILRDCMALQDVIAKLPCPSCTTEITSLARNKRQALWNHLPAFFNLSL